MYGEERVCNEFEMSRVKVRVWVAKLKNSISEMRDVGDRGWYHRHTSLFLKSDCRFEFGDPENPRVEVFDAWKNTHVAHGLFPRL